MAYYLLKTLETYIDQEQFAHHVLEAQDEQMVKYWFHKTLAEWNYREADYSHHCREHWDMGHVSEIQEIRELSRDEWAVLSDHLHSWHKPD